MKKLHLHPLTLPAFLIIYLTGMGKTYFTLYFYIFLHELAHLLAGVLSGAKSVSLCLCPWGCILSFKVLPKKSKCALIYLAGPLLNLLLAFLGISLKENLTLAFFNLIPVAPLDGGMLLNLIMPQAAFYISLGFVLVLTIVCIYVKAPLFLPVFIAVILFAGEKNRIDKNLSLRILKYLELK